MSETLTSYLISVAILCALALSIPCIESLARLLRRHSLSKVHLVPAQARSSNNSREAA